VAITVAVAVLVAEALVVAVEVLADSGAVVAVAVVLVAHGNFNQYDLAF
jgi:hypothetical protein